MRNNLVFFLLLIAVSPSRAQVRPAWAPPINTTPSQMDWIYDAPQGSEAPSERPSLPGESVSLVRLRHRPPRKAMAAFLRGIKLASSGAWGQGAEEFRKAVDADSDFSEAHGNLGVAYSSLHRFYEAAQGFAARSNSIRAPG